MRRVFAVLHRWFGLFTAIFLFVAGLTGAVIAWDHELDAWLNPRLFSTERVSARAVGPTETLTLIAQIEKDDARVRVRYFPLAVEAGHTLQVMVEARVDPSTQRPFALSFNQLALDPSNGRVRGRRMWGALSLARENLLPFLYKLHYTLHLPAAFGVECGVLLMGIVALVWTIDCFIALWLSFPSRKTWLKSFSFRLRRGSAKFTFDLHRSGGVWVWALLLTLSVTAVSMNLRTQVVEPLVSLFSPVSPSPFDARSTLIAPAKPALSHAEALSRARKEARRRAISAAPGAMLYAPELGVYGVGFFAPGHDHGDGGLGNPWLYLDARDGHVLGAEIAGRGSAGDLFLQAQFPLHSGRILGLWGRALVSLLGVMVSLLSVTGVLLWARKRRARAKKTRRIPRSVAVGSNPGPSEC